MVVFQRTPRADMAARHAAAAARKRPVEKREPRLRNVQPALDLGSTAFIPFRGRHYGVPPVPWDAGARLMMIYTGAVRFAGALNSETAPQYYALIRQLPPLLWHLTRPVSRTRRFLKFIGLLPNPFLRATEAELTDLAGFFLTRRLTSSIGQQLATTSLTTET